MEMSSLSNKLSIRAKRKTQDGDLVKTKQPRASLAQFTATKRDNEKLSPIKCKDASSSDERGISFACREQEQQTRNAGIDIERGTNKRSSVSSEDKEVVNVDNASNDVPNSQENCDINDDGQHVTHDDQSANKPESQQGPLDNEEHNSSDNEYLPQFQNSIGKTFELDLTEEVKEYMKKLSAQFLDENKKDPTVTDVKCIGAAALGVLLKYNDRAVPKGTTKNELAKMVFDYLQNGCPPRCPKCRRGSLRFSNGKKKSGKRYYWCPGSAKGSWFVGCNFKADKKDIERIPWKNPV